MELVKKLLHSCLQDLHLKQSTVFRKFQRGADEAAEERMCFVRTGFELRMILYADIERAIRNLYGFHEPAVRRKPR